MLINRCWRVTLSRCLRRASTTATTTDEVGDLFDDDDGISAPFEEEEEVKEPRLLTRLERCEAWLHNMEGERTGMVSLEPRVFGLPPRTQLLAPVIRRQLKYQIQDDTYGSEENNFIHFHRLSDPLYTERPELSPWIKQGLAWRKNEFAEKTEIVEGATSHNPIPYYTGEVPQKLREVGLKMLLSIKYRYDKLRVVENLSTPDRYVEPGEFRALLGEEWKVGNCLMITGNRITPHVASPTWKRVEPFPAPYPGTQRLWKTVSGTTGCELREVEGLDVWSGLLYETLVLDMAAVAQLQRSLLTAPFTTQNVNLRRVLERVDTRNPLGPAEERHKMIRVVNLDNL